MQPKTQMSYDDSGLLVTVSPVDGSSHQYEPMYWDLLYYMFLIMNSWPDTQREKNIKLKVTGVIMAIHRRISVSYYM